MRRVKFPVSNDRELFFLIAAVFTLLISTTVIAEPLQDRQQEIMYLLRHDCGSCHGMTLKGGLGPALTVNSLQGKSSEQLINTIMYGVSGTPMPPWAGILTHEEISWLVKQLIHGTTDKYVNLGHE